MNARSTDSIVSRIETRLLEPVCNLIQFDAALSEGEYEAVARLLANRPDVTLRVFGHSSHGFEDLSFLKHFPALRRFHWDLWEIESWNGLQYLPDDLESLRIGWTRSKAHSVQFLSRFTGLKELYLEGHTKGIQAISDLKNLSDLTLRSITLPDLSLLVGLKNLVSLDLKLGGTKNLDLLPELNQLRYLELWLIRGLTDISVIGSINSLQRLHLESLKRVEALPDMSKLTELKGLLIQNMKGLSDLSPIRTAPALENLIVWESPQLKPEHFECLIGHPTLCRISIGLSSDKKCKQVEDMLGMRSITGARLANMGE